MTWLADLSDYRYGAPADRPMLAVGWLDPAHPFPRGPVDADVRDRLLVLAARPRRVMRGLHPCGFCDAGSPVLDVPGWRRRRAHLGNGEVHVEGDGVLYAAPTLVVHYIDAHGYQPPAEFCAVVAQSR